MKSRILLIILFATFGYADGDIFLNGTAGEDLDRCLGISIFSEFDPSDIESQSIYKLVSTVGSPFTVDGITTYDVANGEADFSFLFDGIAHCPAPAGGVTKGDLIYIKHADSTLSTSAASSELVGESLTTSAAGDNFELYFHPLTTGSGGGGGTNALLDGSNHTDTTSSAVTAGDLIFGNSTPAWDDLAIGSNGKWLKVVSGLPSWETLTVDSSALLDGSIHTDTTNSAVTRGDIIIGNSTPAWDDLPIGTSGYVLTSNGTDPSWASIGSPAGCDRRNCQEFMEEFVGARAAVTGTSTTAGIMFFNYGWDYTSNLTGEAHIVTAGAVALASDIRSSGWAISTGTNAAGGLCAGLGFRPVIFTEDSGEGAITLEGAFYIEELSNASHTFEFAIGLGDYGTGGACNNTSLGMTTYERIFYSHGTNSGKFQCQWKGSGTSTADSGITATSDAWWSYKIVTDATHSQVDIYLSDANPPNFSSPVCTYSGVDLADGNGQSPNMSIRKTAGTSGDRQVYIDYTYLRIDYTTGR